jgi:uncharacterized protein YgiM (DUF1202 family)
MKIKFGLILAGVLSTAAIAQPQPSLPGSTNAPSAEVAPMVVPPEAAATTNAPSAKPKKSAAKKKSAPKASAKKSTTPDMPFAPPAMAGEPAVAIKNNVTVRGQAHINSEVVGHLKKGDTVNVLEIVTLKHPGTDEPSKWARISLPSDMHVWMSTSFLNGTNQTISARKLNLRTGPGENFSIVGLLHKGDTVKTVGTKGTWTEIESPTNAFAFVAAHLLSHKEAPPVEPVPPVVPPTPIVLGTPSSIAPAASGTPNGAEPVVPIVTPPIPKPLPAAPEPLPRRVVEREGVVGGTVSIQAPSHYQLKSLDNGNVMDYLYTTSTNVVLKSYKGMTVLVSGEEELDERWPNTPVLTIQRIQIVK